MPQRLDRSWSRLVIGQRGQPEVTRMNWAVKGSGRPLSDAGRLLTEVDAGCESIDLLDHLNDNEESGYLSKLQKWVILEQFLDFTGTFSFDFTLYFTEGQRELFYILLKHVSLTKNSKNGITKATFLLLTSQVGSCGRGDDAHVIKKRIFQKVNTDLCNRIFFIFLLLIISQHLRCVLWPLVSMEPPSEV